MADSTMTPSTAEPPLELTVVVAPLCDPTPPQPPPPPDADQVVLVSVATATAALVFATLTWWSLGG